MDENLEEYHHYEGRDDHDEWCAEHDDPDEVCEFNPETDGNAKDYVPRGFRLANGGGREEPLQPQASKRGVAKKAKAKPAKKDKHSDTFCIEFRGQLYFIANDLRGYLYMW